MPSFPSTRALELRKYLEERDRKGSRKRRWQLKTLLGWFSLGSKRLNGRNLAIIQREMEEVGIDAYPSIAELSSIKDRVNLTLITKPHVASLPPKKPPVATKKLAYPQKPEKPTRPLQRPQPKCVEKISLTSNGNALLLGTILAEGNSEHCAHGGCHLLMEDLLTHTFICGTTGSGKTVNLKIMVEEAALKGIPSIVVDLKGDLTSLSIPLKRMSRETLEPWVEPSPGLTPAEEASEESKRFLNKWREQGYGEEEFKGFQERVEFGIYTPRSKKGTHQVGVSFVANPPADWEEMYDNDPEVVRGMIRDSSMALLMRLYPKIDKVTLEMGFLEELILAAWRNGVPLKGREGLQNLVALIQKPPKELKVIGAMELNDYLLPQKRMELASRVNSLLVGANSVWFEGISADDIEAILEARPNKTKIAIINMSDLDFYDRAFVLSHLGYGLFRWARKLGGMSSPRVIFAVDEIGGGGGKEAFFPPLPYVSVSKPALNLLLRQGRAFGICCLFATQNPGDIDYKGLSNCHTWIIGRLATRRDRDKIRQGISDAEVNLGDVDTAITSVNAGEFLIHKKNGAVEYFKQRWLLTFYKVLSPNEVSRLATMLGKETGQTL